MIGSCRTHAPGRFSVIQRKTSVYMPSSTYYVSLNRPSKRKQFLARMQYDHRSNIWNPVHHFLRDTLFYRAVACRWRFIILEYFFLRARNGLVEFKYDDWMWPQHWQNWPLMVFMPFVTLLNSSCLKVLPCYGYNTNNYSDNLLGCKSSLTFHHSYPLILLMYSINISQMACRSQKL